MEAYESLRIAFAELCRQSARSVVAENRYQAGLKEWDVVCEHPLITHVGIGEDCVLFGLRRYLMHGPSGYRWNDPLAVRICMSAKSVQCNPAVETEWYKEHGFVHPHVHAGGFPCFGQQNTTALSMLFGSGDVLGLVRFVIEFLQLYKGSNHCHDCRNWPLATPEEVEAWNRAIQ